MNRTRPARSFDASRQQPGGADEHRRVRVVPARVHLVADAGCEVEPGVLVQRQGVHVAAQQHGRARFRAGEQGGDAARGLVDGDVERERVDGLEHLLPRDRQVVADLGVAMQRPAQLDGVGQQSGRLVEQPGGADPLGPFVVGHPRRHGVTVTLVGLDAHRTRPEGFPFPLPLARDTQGE